jgi:hypothetical protein
MRAFLLSLLLSLAPLPGLPWIPPGSEVRLVSPDLRTVYASYLVSEDRRLIARAKGVSVPIARDILLFIQTGGKPYIYSGLSAPRGDVWLNIEGGQISLNELLTRTYRLSLPDGKVLPEER